MSAAGWVATASVSLPWVVLMGVRAHRAWRNPDRWDGGGFGGGVFSRRYVEKQFEKPRDERDLL
jgi:hypothetical protein